MRRRVITSLLIILFLGLPAAIGGSAPSTGAPAATESVTDVSARVTDIRLTP